MVASHPALNKTWTHSP